VSWEAGVVRAHAPHVLARSTTATAVSVAGAAGAHTWAGGDVPTGPGLLLVAAVVLAGSLLVFRRDVPAWTLLPLVAAAQLGVHESFGLVAGHDHGATAPAGPGWTWQMVAAHAFVTLLTAALWWAGRRAGTYAVPLRERPAPPVLGEVCAMPAGDHRHPSLVHLLVSPRRGPPLTVLPT
jgi:hypothetical protein